jgi:hypothetical protein
MPEVNYFRLPQTQQMMLDILFVCTPHDAQIMY